MLSRAGSDGIDGIGDGDVRNMIIHIARALCVTDCTRALAKLIFALLMPAPARTDFTLFVSRSIIGETMLEIAYGNVISKRDQTFLD